MSAPQSEAGSKRGIGGSIADRLRQVESRAALHDILREIAARNETGSGRWSKTQVRFYLLSKWRDIADEYFDGERLKRPEHFPPIPTPLDAPVLADALRRCAERLGSTVGEGAGDELPPRGPGLRDLLATPEPAGDTHIANMLRALREEMRSADSRNPKRFRLSKGKCIRAREGAFIYQFTWSSEPDPHAPGELHVAGNWIPARVGESAPGDALYFELVVESWLGPAMTNAVFRVDPTFLLRVVYERIRSADAVSTAAATWADHLQMAPQRDIGWNVPAVEMTARLNPQQRNAIGMAATADRGYVWGPPGTGKTTTIGALVRSQVRAGARILILSPYNVAVDEAVLAAVRAEDSNRRVLRLGRAGPEVRSCGCDLDSQLEREAANTGLLAVTRELFAAVTARVPGENSSPPSTVRACLDQLGAIVVRNRGARDDPATVVLLDTINKIRRDFREPASRLLHDADVVACTMALSFLKEEIFARPFDHLIIDEASVVRTPEAVLAATTVGARITFFGDPKQLPAIVLTQGTKAAKWLGRSPFAMANVARPADAVGSCVLLEEQHRMAPPIRGIVSKMFYDGVLRDGAHAPKQGQVVVVDTARSGARATPKLVRLSQSKENVLHRAIVAAVLRAVGRREAEARALVVCPFVAQKRAYRRERSTTEALRHAPRFETIHTSQGSEQDVVVLDFVLAGTGIGTRSRMLDDRSNPHLANLLNVAISRTKRTLVIVCDCDLVRREYKGGLLEKLLLEAESVGRRVQVHPRLEGLTASLDEAFAFQPPVAPPSK